VLGDVGSIETGCPVVRLVLLEFVDGRGIGFQPAMLLVLEMEPNLE
jgi:hypothetical protein